MKLHELKPAAGAVKKAKRIGRGQGSGKGGTSTRGHKGAKSRSGNSIKRGFEGGQNPLQRRLPKKGFKNFNSVVYEPFNFSKISELIEKYNLAEFSYEALRAHKLVNKSTLIKVLANGELTKVVNFTVHAISAKAKEQIEAKGGTVNVI